MGNNINLPEEEVAVKISTCNKCGGIVRTAVEHLMDTKSKNEFAKEAMKHNLSIKTISLLEYQATETKWCECE
jgi:hypothetical protein